MRLAAQAKLGFYPAHPIAIAELLKHLYCRLPNVNKPTDTLQILDPCAGKGDAIKQIADALSVAEDGVYTVELDQERSDDIKKLMPKSHHVGPASAMGVQITGYSFGLVYCNPPFDNELGGGKREEQAFAERSTRMLCTKGILVLVCPYAALSGNRNFCQFLDSHYEDMQVYKFPDGVDPETGKPIRLYNEIVVIGRKRKDAVPNDMLSQTGQLYKMGWYYRGTWSTHTNDQHVKQLPSLGQTQPNSWWNGQPSYDRKTDIDTWEIPLCWRPHTFKKTMFTDDELVQVVESSPIHRHLKEVTLKPPSSPPLPLDKGHLGLILASGMLDGVVEGPHGVHVVRGSSHKVMYHNKEQSNSTENPETGAVTTKDVYSERMVTVIRCAVQDGRIFTHSNDAAEKEEADEIDGD